MNERKYVYVYVREKKEADRQKGNKKKSYKKFHNLIEPCGHHLTSSVSICVCQRNHYGTQAVSSILELAFLQATSCLMCSVLHKCVYVYGDNCFLARKTSLSSDQVLSCSLFSFVVMIYLTMLSAGGQINEQSNGKRLALLLLCLRLYVIVVHPSICISIE
jgi:hypothetical protein